MLKVIYAKVKIAIKNIGGNLEVNHAFVSDKVPGWIVQC